MMTVSMTRNCVERELVLAQNADLLRARDRALGRLDLAGQDLHQSRFAGAVRAGDRVAAARQRT